MLEIVVSFFVSLSVIYLIIHYQHLHGHVTADNDLMGIQKFHAIPVPRVGGIGVFFGMICGEAVKILIDPESYKLGVYVVMAAMPAFSAGLAEDLTKRVSVLNRLYATATSAAVGGLLVGAWLTRIDISVIDDLLMFGLISAIVTCFAVAGVANAFNLIDGYNGLAGGVSIIIMTGLGYVASQVGDHQIARTVFVFEGAVMGFLVWNYPRGLIFLGDGGAYLIGFIIAELSVLLVARNPMVSPWFPLLLASYPICETLFTIFRRTVISKSNPGMPDAAHLHQLIYGHLVSLCSDANCTKNKKQRNSMTSPYLWILTTLAAVPAVMYWNDTSALQLMMLFFFILYIVTYIRVRKSMVPIWIKIFNRNSKI